MFIFLSSKKHERHFGLPQDRKKVRGKYWSSGKLENTYGMKSKGEGKIYLFFVFFKTQSTVIVTLKVTIQVSLFRIYAIPPKTLL